MKLIQPKQYKAELKALPGELCHLQRHIRKEGLRVVVILEGRDASGKGGVIKRLTEHLDPNHYRTVAKGKPTAEEDAQWYFQRWVSHLPRDGEIVFFDRSWYTRCLTESVMGFATKKEVTDFLNNVNRFEKMLHQQGVIVIKYWLSITQATQEQRFHQRLNDIRKMWKLSEMDLKSRYLWDEYTKAKERMFKRSCTEHSPWVIVDTNDKKQGRLDVIEDLLCRFEFEHIPYEPQTLPKINLKKKD